MNDFLRNHCAVYCQAIVSHAIRACNLCTLSNSTRTWPTICDCDQSSLLSLFCSTMLKHYVVIQLPLAAPPLVSLNVCKFADRETGALFAATPALNDSEKIHGAGSRGDNNCPALSLSFSLMVCMCTMNERLRAAKGYAMYMAINQIIALTSARSSEHLATGALSPLGVCGCGLLLRLSHSLLVQSESCLS